MAKTITLVGVCGRSRKAVTATERPMIDPCQEFRLRIALADHARAERADDVEEADQRQRDHGVARLDPEVADIGREMRGDERHLEAADEEAGDEQRVAAMRQRPRRSALPTVCCAALFAALCELPRRGTASSGTTSIITAMMSRACPTSQQASIRPWPIGANRNMPAEPAAVPMPKTIERFSGGVCRANAASTMEKEPAATPKRRPARRRRYGAWSGCRRSPSDRGRRRR